MLGFGGHFLTKARRYSITFGLLRDTARRLPPHRAHRPPPDSDDTVGTITVGTLAFVGSGWQTPATPCSPTPPPPNAANAKHRPGGTRPRGVVGGGGVTRHLTPSWYSPAEVAVLLGFGLSKVKMKIATGELRSIKDGKYRRVLPEWVDEYVREQVQRQEAA